MWPANSLAMGFIEKIVAQILLCVCKVVGLVFVQLSVEVAVIMFKKLNQDFSRNKMRYETVNANQPPPWLPPMKKAAL